MKKLIFIACLFAASAQAQQIATTEKTHREVILYEDHTWEYTGPAKQEEPKQQSQPKKPCYRCESLTKKGLQCKIMTTDSTKVCYVHRRNKS